MLLPELEKALLIGPLVLGLVTEHCPLFMSPALVRDHGHKCCLSMALVIAWLISGAKIGLLNFLYH
jgi:hypothetical protein